MPPPPFPYHLEPRYLRAIAAEWRRINEQQLRGALRPPTFELIDSGEHLGRWTLQTRTLALARRLVHKQPWGVVVEVLRHEMAHQFAHEVLKATDEVAHGPAFREVCTRFAIDARAAGLPEANAADQRLHRRVEKLLALAASDNRNEAEVAMAEARKLLLIHNLSAPPTSYAWRHLGKPTGRVSPWRRELAALLGTHFFVQTIWVYVYDVHHDDWRTVLEVCGTPGNVDMAGWVHDWLESTGERLWVAESPGLVDRGRSAHQHFLGGVIRGFAERLAAGAKKSAEEGLVWVKDPKAEAYLGARHGKVHSVRYTVRSGDAAWSAGYAQGRELVLNKPVEAAAGNRGRLLKG